MSAGNLRQTILTGNAATPTQRQATSSNANVNSAQPSSQDRNAASAEKTRQTRRTGTVPPIDKMSGEITDAGTGLSFLSAKFLLAPSGGTPSLTALAEALFQIAVLPNTPLQTVNGIRSVAYLLRDTVTKDTAEEVSALVNKSLETVLKNVQEKIVMKTEEGIEKLTDKIEEITNKAKETVEGIGKVSEKVNNAMKKIGNTPNPYRDALIGAPKGPPVVVDPRIRAKEGIRGRQSLWNIQGDVDELRHLSAPALLRKMNEMVGEASKVTNEACKLRSAIWLKSGNMLIEASDDKSAEWLRAEANIHHMECELGAKITPECRNYNVIAYFVPLTFEPDDHKEELADTNNIPESAISKYKWAKAKDRRKANQTVGHLILTFTNPDAVNKAILDGLVICNKKVSVAKCRREPVRCLKCQGYNHVATECIIQRDVCAQCGSDHKSTNCTSLVRKCTPCDTYGHSSSDRTCQTFICKCEDYDTSHPENTLPFYPSTEPWMWEALPPRAQHQQQRTEALIPYHRTGWQNLRQTQLPYQPTRNLATTGREYQRLSWDRPDVEDDNTARPRDTQQSQPPNPQIQIPSSPREFPSLSPLRHNMINTSDSMDQNNHAQPNVGVNA